MTRRALSAVLLVCALAVPAAAPAWAGGDCPSGTGRLTSNALTANVCVPGQSPANPGPSSNGASSGAPSSGSPSAGEPSPYKWSRNYLDDSRPAGSQVGDPCWNTDAAGNQTPAAGNVVQETPETPPNAVVWKLVRDPASDPHWRLREVIPFTDQPGPRPS